MADENISQFVLEQIGVNESHVKRFHLTGGKENEEVRTVVVGRLQNCDICLDSPDLPCFISRQHANITVENSQVFVTDLKSVNGTFINDIMLAPYAKTHLKLEATVMFGCVSLEAAIQPGSLVKQVKPLFKFVLKKSDTKGQSLKKIKQTKKFEYLSIRESDCESDENEDGTVKEKIVPLTVKNLIAYAGCSFTTEILSDEKENISRAKTVVLPKIKNTTATKKLKRKRRQTTSYSRKKRAKKETCSFFECKISQFRKSNSVISWVQCDFCNKWYHTDCIGCDYNTVKLAKNKFGCGQC